MGNPSNESLGHLPPESLIGTVLLDDAGNEYRVIDLKNDNSVKPVNIGGGRRNVWDAMIIYEDVNGNRTIGTFEPYSRLLFMG